MIRANVLKVRWLSHLISFKSIDYQPFSNGTLFRCSKINDMQFQNGFSNSCTNATFLSSLIQILIKLIRVNLFDLSKMYFFLNHKLSNGQIGSHILIKWEISSISQNSKWKYIRDRKMRTYAKIVFTFRETLRDFFSWFYCEIWLNWMKNNFSLSNWIMNSALLRFNYLRLLQFM